MKTCSVCKFYSENQDIIRMQQNCCAPGIEAMVIAVLGTLPEGAMIPAVHARFNDSFCGMEGKWWEAIPTDPERDLAQLPTEGTA